MYLLAGAARSCNFFLFKNASRRGLFLRTHPYHISPKASTVWRKSLTSVRGNSSSYIYAFFWSYPSWLRLREMSRIIITVCHPMPACVEGTQTCVLPVHFMKSHLEPVGFWWAHTTAPLCQWTLSPMRSLRPGNNFGTVSFSSSH